MLMRGHKQQRESTRASFGTCSGLIQLYVPVSCLTGLFSCDMHGAHATFMRIQSIICSSTSVALHTLYACAQCAAFAHLGKAQVNQLGNAVKQHNVVGLQVAVSVPENWFYEIGQGQRDVFW